MHQIFNVHERLEIFFFFFFLLWRKKKYPIALLISRLRSVENSRPVYLEKIESRDFSRGVLSIKQRILCIRQSSECFRFNYISHFCLIPIYVKNCVTANCVSLPDSISS
ncbi:hypothetical protein PUN28_005912 [Cardiocondyla obscurior]|uniref:Secreted protein n=1 Tax=Cardiocondyla obscurior TaxID=286306 RepID=A0AAW2G7W8_9HYME